MIQLPCQAQTVKVLLLCRFLWFRNDFAVFTSFLLQQIQEFYPFFFYFFLNLGFSFSRILIRAAYIAQMKEMTNDWNFNSCQLLLWSENALS